jgi:hypothetical protein
VRRQEEQRYINVPIAKQKIKVYYDYDQQQRVNYWLVGGLLVYITVIVLYAWIRGVAL